VEPVERGLQLRIGEQAKMFRNDSARHQELLLALPDTLSNGPLMVIEPEEGSQV